MNTPPALTGEQKRWAFAAAALVASTASAQSQRPQNLGPVIPGVCVFDPQRAVLQSTAGTPLAMSMLGCDADGATFAVSYVRLADPSQVGRALEHWQAAALARMEGPALVPGAAPAPQPFVPPGALAVPQAVRTTVLGRRPDGAAVAAQAVWFARAVGGEVLVYHAVVLSPKPQPAVADRVHLLAQPDARHARLRVPGGTVVRAGADAAGQPRLFATRQDLIASQVRVAALCSLRVHIRETGIAQASRQYLQGGTRQQAFLAMLRIALGAPHPGDPLPVPIFPGLPAPACWPCSPVVPSARPSTTRPTSKPGRSRS